MHQPLLEPGPGYERLHISVGWDGQAVALWAARSDAATLTATETLPAGVRFPASRARAAPAAMVTVQTSSERRQIELDGVPVAHPMVEAHPDGGVLVAGARCRYDIDTEMAERNAVRYDAKGHITATATLGDGISSMGVTPSGRVWVGYFDEGVYGNYGWGEPGAPRPVGAAGLARFAPDLSREWEFPLDSELRCIDDCYMLNVVGEEAWTCYYSDFPVVRVVDDTVTAWSLGEPAGALVVLSEDRVAMVGQGEHPDMVRIFRLEQGRAVPEGTAVLEVNAPGVRLADLAIVARGAELHAFGGGRWWRLSA